MSFRLFISKFFTLTLITSAVMLIGCQQQAEKKTKTINLILDWYPNPNHVPIYAGIDKGFFKEQGIHLKIMKVIIDPDDAFNTLLNDQAEIVLTYMPHTIQHQIKGAAIEPIGILTDQTLNSVIYRLREGIEKPEDLHGKVIGYCGELFSAKFIKEWFSGKNIVPGELKDVGLDFVRALRFGDIDAIAGAYWNLEGEHFRQWGIDVGHFLTAEFGMPNYYELIFVVKKGSNKTDPNFVKAFKTAMQNSIDYSVNNPEQAFDAYSKMNPKKSPRVMRWGKRAWLKTIPILAKHQEIDQNVWAAYAKWLVDHNLQNGFAD